MKGSQKPKKTGKKPAQKSLKERRSEKRAAAKTVAVARRVSGQAGAAQHGVEQIVEAGGRKANRGVRCAVVEPDLVRRPIVDEAAREHGVRDVADPLVRRIGREDPLRQPMEDAGRLVEVEQGEPDAVDAAADHLLDAVVDQQPAVLGLERRRPDARCGSRPTRLRRAAA